MEREICIVKIKMKNEIIQPVESWMKASWSLAPWLSFGVSLSW